MKVEDLIGKTRGEIALRLQFDWGLNGIYKGERFAFLKDGHPLFFSVDGAPTMQCKIVIDFRPRGISSDIYNNPDRFAAWALRHRQSGGRRRALDLVIKPLRLFGRKEKPSLIFSGDATDAIVRVSSPYLGSITPD